MMNKNKESTTTNQTTTLKENKTNLLKTKLYKLEPQKQKYLQQIKSNELFIKNEFGIHARNFCSAFVCFAYFACLWLK
jgi:hypothetical protein